MKKKKVKYTKRENISDKFSVMETAIDLSLQQEYINISKTIDFDNINYRELLAESKKLFFENIPIESKKKILIHLAHSGTAESYTECFLKAPFWKIMEGLYLQDLGEKTTSLDITSLPARRMTCHFQKLKEIL
jgi:hypothetical protein